MKILAIGNSFSQDSTRYLHGLARSCGLDMKVVNLYIGGCSLEMHAQNICQDASAYELELNGFSSGFYVSIKEALLSDNWDFVTLQQVSNLSPDYQTYQPDLDALAACVRTYAPNCQLLLHQTWAYEEGSERLCGMMGYARAAEMFADIQSAYSKAAAAVNARGILPCGQVFAKLSEEGVGPLHRDTFHATRGLGRYALALTWLTCLTGIRPETISFQDFDEPVSAVDADAVKQAVAAVCAETFAIK